MTFTEKSCAVLKELGKGNYQEYRIPGIAVSGKGTIFCVLEGRMNAQNDWAAIDTLILRSKDGGKTWDERAIGDATKKSSEPCTVGNPTLIVDEKRIHILFCRDYERMYIITSEDDGETWSEEREITDCIRNRSYEWNVCAVGPGHGIRLKNGMLAAPIWLANGEAQSPRVRKHWPSTAGLIVSEDGGRHWKLGALVEGVYDANETTICEAADGSILLNIRHRGLPMQRVLGMYRHGTERIANVKPHPELPDTMCFGSMTKLEGDGIAFTNCEGHIDEKYLNAADFAESAQTAPFGKRENLTLKVSTDDGNSWKKSLVVDETGGYSDIAYHDGTLYVLYEQTVRGVIEHVLLKTYRIDMN